MFKIERKPVNGVWYEVMLSPVNTINDVREYYKKYSRYYPVEERNYRITNLTTLNTILIPSIE
jgi:hypothetical protein